MHGKWIAVAVLTFASAGQALAQDDQDGVYIGVGLGDFGVEIDEINFDESDTASKLFAGWRFNQFFAIQADYYDLGSGDSTVLGQNLEIETSGFVARIEGTLPLSFFELFATAGLFYSDVETSFGGIEDSDSNNDPVYSVGAGFEIAERFTVRLEYEIIDVDAFDDSEAYWLTAAWRF